MKKLIYIFLFFAAIGAKAQETFSITGKVTDEKSEPMPGATVFITNSKSMTSANTAGEFSLNGLQPGTYELVVKMIGFNPFTKQVSIQKQSINVSVKLSESSTFLNEVVINGKPDPNHTKYLKIFTQNFIGSTPNADQCKILNPEVIRLHYDKEKNILEATANDLIQVENKALGYKLNYLLTRFLFNTETNFISYEGKPYFEELKGSEIEQKLWDKKRKIAYEGSKRHFFRALFNGTTEAEGFVIYQLPGKVNKVELAAERPVNTNSLVSVIDNNTRLLKLYSLYQAERDTNKFFVIYNKQEEPSTFYYSDAHIRLPLRLAGRQAQVSQLDPYTDNVEIDKNGTYTPANSFLYAGYWAWERVADLTPLDYHTEAPKPIDGKLIDIKAALDTFRNRAPIEKVHIQFDKPYYTLGDTIWMKAYVVNESNILSEKSKIVYADLIRDDSIRTTLRMPLTLGLGWGAITLSDTLFKEGNYHIRAYTNLMRNFGEEYFFDRSIKIGNALPPMVKAGNTSPKAKPITQVVTTPTKDDATNISVQLFPEGGDLVNGIASKVAFKITGTNGLSREATGIIVDKDNRQITTFSTEHAGMGTFMLNPVAGNIYTAVVKFNGSEKRVELPKAKDTGYTLSVTQNEVNVVVKVETSGALIKKGEVTLIVQGNNIVQYTGKKELTSSNFVAVIPKNRFPEGISQFTLFSPDYQPVAERLVFIRHNDNHLIINAIPEKTDYKTRGKVHLDIQVLDQEGMPVAGDFSIAVTDEGKVPYAEADEKTIFSNLLLSANLKGYIEHPNYYFTRIDSAKLVHLDNLLLTQGWRRFVWSDILNNKLPALAYGKESSIGGISGRVLASNGKPAIGARINIVLDIDSGLVLDTVTNAEGRFNFGNLGFRKGTKFNISATDAKGKKNVTVELEQLGPQPVTLKHLPDEEPDDNSMATYMQSSRKRFDELDRLGLLSGRVLKEVVINQYVKNETVKKLATMHSANLAGAGNADQVLTFVDLARCVGSLGPCLAGRLTGVQIQIGPHGQWVATSRNFDTPMAVIIDGIAGRDPSYLSIDDISSIEVLRGGGAAALYGMSGANGVLIITTKSGDVDYNAYVDERYRRGSTKPQGLKTYVYQGGYDYRRQFYTPDYNNALTNTVIADFRSTIYWNPNIITNESGKASVEFFNSDSTGNYKIIIEGVTLDGKIGRQVTRYAVK